MDRIFIIMGLYKYVRYNKFYPERYNKVKREVELFKKFNKDKINISEILFLAGDIESKLYLESLGFNVYKTFIDVPNKVKENKAHFLKHYMVLWAAERFKNVLWLDWDVFILKEIDQIVFNKLLCCNTPKFIYIPNYWARVNCGVYYTNYIWTRKLKGWLDIKLSQPNDELIWAYYLPKDIEKLSDFWLNPLAINVWTKAELANIKSFTYFLHLKTFEFIKNENFNNRKYRFR